MHTHLDLDDASFENQFRNLALSPNLFTHEAHLRLAWIHLEKYGEKQAIENVCSQILNFTSVLGQEDKFNRTLTIAGVKAVHHFRQKSVSNNFLDFIKEFPRLNYNFKELIAHHYGLNIYNDEKAKKVFVEPDLIPFD